MLYLPPPHVPLILDDTHQEFLGVVYHQNSKGYFLHNDSLLHRVVWEFFFGEIPDGYEIHHRDHNPANNQIENLQCLTKSEHHKLHAAAMSKIEIVCPVCGKIFLARANRPAKFCSQHCRFKQKYVPAQKEKRICEWCGQEFETSSKSLARFCSHHCSHQAWLAQLTEGTCVICGKQFSFPRGTPRKTCSKECADILLQRSRARNTELVERHCAHCGKIFHTNAAAPSKFCSRNCRAGYQHAHAREIRKCVICGADFSAVKSTKTLCCSRDCSAKLKAVPADIVEKILAEYVFGSQTAGSRALARKYNISATAVLNIVKNFSAQEALH